MTDEEFNRQYKAAVIAGKVHKLKERTKRLQFFVEEFDGQWNYAMEVEAYLILESHQSRQRAIWRYIRFALWNWRSKWKARLAVFSRYWWHRYIRRLSHDAAMQAACTFLDDEEGE